VIFSENKVTKLLIQEFSLSKYGFRRDVKLNEYRLKRIFTMCSQMNSPNFRFPNSNFYNNK